MTQMVSLVYRLSISEFTLLLYSLHCMCGITRKFQLWTHQGALMVQASGGGFRMKEIPGLDIYVLLFERILALVCLGSLILKCRRLC